MTEKNSIWHEGIVRDVKAQTIEVVIYSHSACSGCHAKGACGMSDIKQKVIIAERPAFEIKTGDRVVVYAAMGNAVYSVVMAYILPSILIVSAIFFLVRAGVGELTAAVASLVLLGGYFWALYLFRNKIGKKIKFTVSKKNQDETGTKKLE